MCVKRMSRDSEEGNEGKPEERDGAGGDRVLFVLQDTVVISTRVNLDGVVVVVVIYTERVGHWGRVIVGVACKPDKRFLIFTARPPLYRTVSDRPMSASAVAFATDPPYLFPRT